MKVRVVRHYKDEISESYFGYYVSEVFAIDGNKMLVYDYGEYLVPEHFEWVDITETMTPLNENEDCDTEFVVTLEEKSLQLNSYLKEKSE